MYDLHGKYDDCVSLDDPRALAHDHHLASILIAGIPPLLLVRPNGKSATRVLSIFYFVRRSGHYHKWVMMLLLFTRYCCRNLNRAVSQSAVRNIEKTPERENILLSETFSCKRSRVLKFAPWHQVLWAAISLFARFRLRLRYQGILTSV